MNGFCRVRYMSNTCCVHECISACIVIYFLFSVVVFCLFQFYNIDLSQAQVNHANQARKVVQTNRIIKSLVYCCVHFLLQLKVGPVDGICRDYAPGKSFSFQIRGDPGAKVSLVAVDNAVYLLNKDRLTQRKVREFLSERVRVDKLSSRTYHHEDNFYHR